MTLVTPLGVDVAEVLVNFSEPIKSKSGDLYYGRVIAKLASDGLWEAWLEFTLAGSEESVMTRRETEQPNRDHLRYWAQGLTATYLEGALHRALSPAPTTAGIGSERSVPPRPPGP